MDAHAKFLLINWKWTNGKQKNYDRAQEQDKCKLAKAQQELETDINKTKNVNNLTNAQQGAGVRDHERVTGCSGWWKV